MSTLTRRDYEELAADRKRQHIKAEGRGPVNENPDGCYYCGSPHHHSGDCNDQVALSEAGELS